MGRPGLQKLTIIRHCELFEPGILYLDKNITIAAWLTWLGVILFIIGIDAMRQKEKSGYDKLFNLDKNPLLLLAERLGPVIASWFPVANIEGLEQQIIWAGRPYSLSAEVFIGIKIVALGLGFVAGSGLTIMGVPSILIVVIALISYFLPDYFLRDKVEERQKNIRKELPMMLDFLVTSLKSGVKLVPALSIIGNQFQGPLGEELRKTSREIATGKPRAQALKDMAQKTGVDELERFVQTLIVAEERGSADIASNIDDFVRDIRLTRIRKAEEEARKLPTKIVGPLILCIFMPMVVLLLAPIASILGNAL